jgi:uncharacterized phage protein (TIGR02216 family)
MAVGLGALGLTPLVFWAMTPRELDAALRGRFGVARTDPLRRADLGAMMQRFPDVSGQKAVGSRQ